MEVSKTKAVVTIAAVLILAAGSVAVKKIYFPAVDEKFFQLDSRRLQSAPANVFILRPTRFADSMGTGCVVASGSNEPGKYLPRLLGRNVPFEQVIATAYQCQASRVALPKDVPTNRFDFLVTVRNSPVERLQAAVRSKLGYTAGWKERNTEVFQLKVQTYNTPGLRASSAANPNINFKEGRLYFTRVSMEQLSGVLENALKKPVQDKTGRTGTYDFSILWNWRGAKAMDESSVRNSIGELGLTLKKNNDLVQMMVVERAK